MRPLIDQVITTLEDLPPQAQSLVLSYAESLRAQHTAQQATQMRYPL